MEKTIREGSASWFKLLTLKNITLGVLTGGIWLIFPALQVLSSHYKLTAERIFFKTGIINKQPQELELLFVKSVSYHQGIMQRIVGTGDIIIETGSDFIEIKDIAGADQLKERIRSAVHDARKASGVKYQEQL